MMTEFEGKVKDATQPAVEAVRCECRLLLRKM
jgi:hypothetical protein